MSGSQVTSLYQPERIISEENSYSALKFVYDIQRSKCSAILTCQPFNYLVSTGFHWQSRHLPNHLKFMRGINLKQRTTWHMCCYALKYSNDDYCPFIHCALFVENGENIICVKEGNFDIFWRGPWHGEGFFFVFQFPEISDFGHSQIKLNVTFSNDLKSKSYALGTVWPDWKIYWTLCKFLKPLATINLLHS